MVKKKQTKYGYEIKEVKIINNDILLVTKDKIRLLDRTTLAPKYYFSYSSKHQFITKNKIVVANNEVKVVNFLEDKVISSFKVENVSSISLSSVLVAVGKENGGISIYSIIGGKNLLNLNVFKTKIKKISFYGEDIVFVLSGNSIRGVDIINKKIIFKINENSVISTFKIIEDKIFISTLKGELKLYDIKSGNLKRETELKDLVEKMEFVKDILILQYKYKLEALNINSFKRKIIDEDIEFVNFDIGNDELVAIDGKYDILQYSLSDILSESSEEVKEKVKIKEEVEEVSDISKIKFLTVDDSSTMRLIIKNSILNNFDDVEVLEAEDGLKCLEVLEKNPSVDVIFMDWNMPNLNGAETVDKIRENPIYNNIKIIMATTEGAREKVRQMMSKGVKGYLVKPFKPASVIPLAKKMIEIIKAEKNV